MHFWLSQSLDIPNSTVCTSLLEFLMSCFYSQCLRVLSEPFSYRSFRKPQNFRGWVSFRLLSQLESPHIICSNFQKVKRKFENIFKKISLAGFFARNPPFFILIFFHFLFCRPIFWFGFGTFFDSDLMPNRIKAHQNRYTNPIFIMGYSRKSDKSRFASRWAAATSDSSCGIDTGDQALVSVLYI